MSNPTLIQTKEAKSGPPANLSLGTVEANSIFVYI